MHTTTTSTKHNNQLYSLSCYIDNKLTAANNQLHELLLYSRLCVIIDYKRYQGEK